MFDYFDDLEVGAKRFWRNLAWFSGSLILTVLAGYLAARWGLV